jgi:hypothetical protein
MSRRNDEGISDGARESNRVLDFRGWADSVGYSVFYSVYLAVGDFWCLGVLGVGNVCEKLPNCADGQERGRVIATCLLLRAFAFTSNSRSRLQRGVSHDCVFCVDSASLSGGGTNNAWRGQLSTGHEIRPLCCDQASAGVFGVLHGVIICRKLPFDLQPFDRVATDVVRRGRSIDRGELFEEFSRV